MGHDHEASSAAPVRSSPDDCGGRGGANPVSRRRFLSGAGGAVLAAPLVKLGEAGGAPAAQRRRPPRATLPDGLFSLGVGSGDPLSDAVVLWTRLAPAPLAGGGMPAVDVPVRWEVASDEGFRRVVRAGRTTASPRWGHSVHVDVRHLRPGAWYFYRFRVGDQHSPVGRTRTAPARGHRDRLRFLFASCQNWQDGFWSAWANAAGEDPDLVVHLGDYIYEGGINAAAPRQHNSPEITTLDAYRNRYGLYKGDPAIQRVHAACPWVVTWDDHEVENNYAGLLPQVPADAPGFPARRAAAYQAWWEHQPVRLRPPTGADLRIHRTVDWGRLARFHVLDTRQYRGDQPCGAPSDLGSTCAGRTDPAATLLGPDQEAWLGRSLRRSKATWDVLANQMVMTAMPLGGAVYNLDQWDGYAAARARLLDQIDAARVANPVVITGDIHAAGVGDLVGENPDGTPSTEVRGSELVGTSISSGFPADQAEIAEQLIAALPHVRWADTRHRGYVRCDVDRHQLVARYQQVADVLQPDSPVATGRTWVIEAGVLGPQEA
jgi:alkaline phosphatase D